MNDSSEMFDQDVYSQKPPRSGRPVRQSRGMHPLNIDREQPDSMLQSTRSSKRVRFDKVQKSSKAQHQMDQFIDQDDSRPELRARPKMQQQTQLSQELDSFDKPIPPLQKRLRQQQALPTDDYRSYRSQQYSQQEQPQLSKRSQISKAFEPQYQSSRKQLEWAAKPTKEGFIYFYIPGTNTYQWAFPTYFDATSGKKKTYFLQQWTAKTNKLGKTYYINTKTQASQEVKPDSETYILQAAMLGNIAFIELYIQIRGDLGIEDQRGRNALHQAVANGHHQATQLFCEFGMNDNLLERSDRHGCTPLFSAIRYNQTDCLQILLQYNCNLFHRNKKGDTCLHYAAQYNSEQCIMVLAPFCGQQLMSAKNKEGLNPMEQAQKLRNYSCVNTLQVCERSIVYQNAMLYRDQQQGKDPRFAAQSRLMGGVQAMADDPQNVPKRNPHVKRFADDNISENSYGMENLDLDQHYTQAYSQRNQEMKALTHEREYRSKTNRDRQMERMHVQESRVPKFQRSRVVIEEPEPPRMSSRPQRTPQLMSDSYGDEEMQYKVKEAARNRQRQELYDVTPKEREVEQATYFEKAYDGLSRLGTFLGSVKSKVVDYVYNETPRVQSRSRNRVQPYADDEIAPRQRQRSRSARVRQVEDTLNSEDNYQRDLAPQESSGSSHYKTTYDRRSQSRPVSAGPRSRSRPQLIESQEDDSIAQPHTQRPQAQPSELPQFQNQRWQSNNSRSPSITPPPPVVTPPPPAIKKPSNRLEQLSSPPKASTAQQAEVSQVGEQSVVEMRSICIQAQPPKRVRKSKKKADVSRHSIGVGSQRIDETTMPIQNLSETELDSSASKLDQTKTKRQRQLRLGNQTRGLIQKRYQSEEDDRQRLEESKNFSPSPQPTFMKPRMIIHNTHLMNPKQAPPDIGQIKSPLQETAAPTKPETQPQQNLNNSRFSERSVASRRSHRVAPVMLTQEQMDIINLNGAVKETPNTQYKLEPVSLLKPVEQPVAIPESPKPTPQVKKIDLSPFLAKSSKAPVEQIRTKSTEEVIDFNPEMQDEENYQFHLENLNHYSDSSHSILYDLNQEHYSQVSDASFLPTAMKFAFNQTAASVDRCHMMNSVFNCSTNSVQQRASLIKPQPLKMLSLGYPQSDCEGNNPKPTRKVIMPLLPKKVETHQQRPQDLFSEESEKCRLHQQAQMPKQEHPKGVIVQPDDSYVFQGLQSPDQSINRQVEQQEPIDVPPFALGQSNQKSNSSRANQSGNLSRNRYDKPEEDQLIAFDITQEVTQTQEITQNLLIEEARNGPDMVSVDLSRDQQPPFQTEQDLNSFHPKQQDLPQLSVVNYSDKKLAVKQPATPQDNNETNNDTISMLYEGLEEATFTHNKEIPEEPKRDKPVMPLGYASSGQEDEMPHMLANRSTAMPFSRKNTFMSSDDEGKRQPGNVSSMVRKPKKSVKDAAYKRKSKEPEAQPDGSNKVTQSVADKLKSSLQQFKNNKLHMEKATNKSAFSSQAPTKK